MSMQGMLCARRAAVRAAVGVGLLVAAWAAAAGQVITVSPAQGPAALQAELAKAADGDTLELLAGEYPGGLLVEKRKLTLRGLGKVVVKGDGKAADAAHIVFEGHVGMYSPLVRRSRANQRGT